MAQIHLINSVVAWERRLEFEAERREKHPSEPFDNLVAAPQPRWKEQASIFAQIFQRVNENRPPVDFVRELKGY